MVTKSCWDKHWGDHKGYLYPEQSLAEFLTSIEAKKAPPKPPKALYLGVGNGRNIPALVDAGYDFTGLDISEKAVERSNLLISSRGYPNARVQIGKFENLEFEDETFDLVTEVRSLLHQRRDSIIKVVGEVHRVLKPKGRFFSVMKAPKDSLFGKGERIDDLTFVHPKFGETYFIPYEDIYEVFKPFSKLTIGTEERNISGTPMDFWSHWIIVARKGK